MPKRYRLIARAQLHGAVRDPGYEFTLGEGELGPHRTVVSSNHGAQIVDHMNTDMRLEDHPLYVEIEEPQPEPEPEFEPEPEQKLLPEPEPQTARNIKG